MIERLLVSKQVSIVGTDHTKHVDEVSNYLEARYVSASEACYRIFAYELTPC